MKKTSSKTPQLVDVKLESDKAKRIYRAAQDTIRRLDEKLKKKKAHKDIFSAETVGLRQKLQDYCERLMFLEPVEYGRRAEELLWRKVYYDIIQMMKHNRKQMKPSSTLESAFRTHLVSASGYYHHLLFRLQLEYGLRLDGIVDAYQFAEPKSHKKPHSNKKEYEEKVLSWARKACHRSLVYLGDIARYQQDYDTLGAQSAVLAQRYYHQALSLMPELGMPHNQLGTLTGGRYYNVDAAYHYLRCLCCENSFEGALGNLTRLVEKNRKRHAEMTQKSPRDLPPDQQRQKDIKRFLVRLMHLIDIFIVSKNKFGAKDLQEACQSCLQDFNLCMFHQAPKQEGHEGYMLEDQMWPDDKAHYLSDEIVFKILIICQIICYHLQKQGNKKVTAAIAFSLALFSHVLNHVVIRLQSALYEVENPRKQLNVPLTEDKEKIYDTTDSESVVAKSEEFIAEDTAPDLICKNNLEDDEATKEDILKIDKRRKKLTKLRRRRRRRHDSGDTTTESSFSFSLSDDSDLSEGGCDIDESDSDSDNDVMNFARDSDSSDTDSEDNLMVSQELRPGFSDDKSEEDVNKNDASDSTDIKLLNISNSLPNGVNNTDVLSDMTEYLNDFPADMLLDSSNFFNQFTKLLNAGKEEGADLSSITDVVQGKKQVAVPPGFDKDPEAQHVQEISEKLANFVIETDTDTTSMPTDTDNSSLPTESELETETTETDQESGDSVIDRSEYEDRRLVGMLIVLSEEGLLASIKCYCDWMRCHPHIIATCAQSSQSLWSRLSVLLNLMPTETDICKQELTGCEEVMLAVEDARTRQWIPTIPLTEDIHLHSFPPLHDSHISINFKSRPKLTLQQEMILRLCCLRRFGYFISKMKSIQFSYDVDKAMFFGPLQIESQQDEKSAQEQMADAEARRNQLMKDMAQLRLEAEVIRLEGSLQSVDKPSLPPYLVADTSVLCQNLPIIKQLASCARFIIIIPLSVIDHLDVLKKESVGSRDGIRWLESEFHKGNRYVRAQKNHEKVTTIPHKNLKKRDKEAWRFVQIVDCCKYLNQQNTECQSKGLVSLLTNLQPTDVKLSLRLKQAMQSAQQEGIILQTALDFHSKWKDVWKSGKG